VKRKGHPFKRSLRYLYLRFIRLRGSPEAVARGMALGVFIGMTPTVGIQIPLTLFLAMLLKENQIAAQAGVWVSNPMTTIPIYTFNFRIGKYLLGGNDIRLPSFSSIHEIIDLGKDLLLPLAIGSLLSAAVAAFISYFITLKVYTAIHKKRQSALEIRREKAKKWFLHGKK